SDFACIETFTTHSYTCTLSLHDALPIFSGAVSGERMGGHRMRGTQFLVAAVLLHLFQRSRSRVRLSGVGILRGPQLHVAIELLWWQRPHLEVHRGVVGAAQF